MSDEYHELKEQLSEVELLITLNEQEHNRLVAKCRAIKLQLDALAYEHGDED